MEKLECQYCGEAMLGRSDKKFCGDLYRSSFHQENRKKNHPIIPEVNKRIRKNYKILCDINPEDKAKAHRDTLLKAGYDFSYLTNVLTTKTGKTYHFCYDKGLLELDNDWYMLVTRFEKK